MSMIVSELLSWLWPFIVGAVGIVAAFLFGRFKQSDKTKEAQSYQKTREKMDDVENLRDPDAAREWLRKRAAERKRNL